MGEIEVDERDRTVHARYPGWEVVRYDRAGKWFLESTNVANHRVRVSLTQAVREAHVGVSKGGEVFLRRPGGGAFDARMKALA